MCGAGGPSDRMRSRLTSDIDRRIEISRISLFSSSIYTHRRQQYVLANVRGEPTIEILETDAEVLFEHVTRELHFSFQF